MGWRSDLLQRLPPRISMPIRARVGFSREPEMALLGRAVGPGDHCIDIGCHLGIYAYHLLRLVGPRGTVTAFEPQAGLAAYLRSAFSPDVRTGRLVVHESALGDAPGEAVLTVPLEGGRPNRGRATLREVEGTSRTETVDVRPLDSVDLTRPVAFIKCDVEGHELAVLDGAADLLAADQPTLLVEIESRHAAARARATFEMLWSMDYDAAVYRTRDGLLGRLAPGTPNPEAAASEWAGRYVYNYVFVPRRRQELLRTAPVIS